MRRALEGLKGVKKAEVSFDEKQAIVTYDPKQVSVEEMIRAINAIGFQAAIKERK